MRLGFSLAEVLITLGIIGIVAAMTIPTLLKDYKERVLVNKVKQGHSLLINSLQLYMAKNNCTDILCLFDTNKSSDEVAKELASIMKNAKVCTAAEGSNKFCKNYSVKSNTPSYKVDGKYEATEGITSTGRIFLPNGIIFRIIQRPECIYEIEHIVRDENGVATGETITQQYNRCAEIYIDVNNIEEPNQLGADVFKYEIPSDGKIKSTMQNLLNNVLLYNKLEYTPYNIGDPVE